MSGAIVFESTFELTPGQQPLVTLPAQGWTNLSGPGSMIFKFNNLANGALINTTQYSNYAVQYRTGSSIISNTVYELVVEMGYIASWTGGNSGYLIELGTLNGGVFTSLASRTGSIAHLGNLTSGVVSGSATINLSTGASVSGDELTVRLAQTSSIGVAGTSDNFGFSNVLLTQTVPEPGTSLSLLLGLAALGAWRSRRV